MIALPIAAGVLLGRFIDQRLASGTFWTLALMGAGVGIACLELFTTVSSALSRIIMSEIASLGLGLMLGLWSTYRLQRDVAGLLRHPSNTSWLLWRCALRFAPIVVVLCILAISSSSAPLAALGGFWLGRTTFLLKGMRFA
jgi:hypothetical protein